MKVRVNTLDLITQLSDFYAHVNRLNVEAVRAHWFFFFLCVEIGLQAVNMDVVDLEMKLANIHKQLHRILITYQDIKFT